MSDTSAADKLLGYEYQFYYFLLTLLQMNKNDVVGFEVLEDVHVENDKSLILCQLKHTTQTSTAGQPKNLTTSDLDLWKTLSLWVNIIKSKNDQKEFINNTQFLFISNKLDNENNDFLNWKKTFDNDKNILIFINHLEKFKTKLEDKNNEKHNDNVASERDKKIDYIKNLLSLDHDILQLFFTKMLFKLGLDDIIGKIKYDLEVRKMIRKPRIDDLFNTLTGAFKEDFFLKTKDKKTVQYNWDKYCLLASPLFDKYKSERLIFEKIKYNPNQEIKNRIFAKQLAGINFKESEIYEADYNRVLMETNLIKLYHDGDVCSDDLENLDDNAKEIWKSEYDLSYLDETSKTLTTAKTLFHNTMRKELSLAGQKIESVKASKGKFISLSDIPTIGWQNDWEEKYSNEE